MRTSRWGWSPRLRASAQRGLWLLVRQVALDQQRAQKLRVLVLHAQALALRRGCGISVWKARIVLRRSSTRSDACCNQTRHANAVRAWQAILWA